MKKQKSTKFTKVEIAVLLFNAIVGTFILTSDLYGIIFTGLLSAISVLVIYVVLLGTICIVLARKFPFVRDLFLGEK